ncbi:hypothetical protein OF377_01210 [Ureaplasma sp. ES3154-GEN]|uniref:hypothetical protein n=1 Tax=Ureaplasma sp. ES3154-GEN TaxID=2984844 RepID=UPI0021E9A793|nr:hypothetical protein [Ureaplasma sp. ES3154-GEN]MCV3743505.1 hypothetical protein [Ureaplasma sp. ES3154-GEN]
MTQAIKKQLRVTKIDFANAFAQSNSNKENSTRKIGVNRIDILFKQDLSEQQVNLLKDLLKNKFNKDLPFSYAKNVRAVSVAYFKDTNVKDLLALIDLFINENQIDYQNVYQFSNSVYYDDFANLQKNKNLIAQSVEKDLLPPSVDNKEIKNN